MGPGTTGRDRRPLTDQAGRRASYSGLQTRPAIPEGLDGLASEACDQQIRNVMPGPTIPIMERPGSR